MKRVNIILPEEEHDEAKAMLPFDGIDSFSVLVRHALKKLQRRKQTRSRPRRSP